MDPYNEDGTCTIKDTTYNASDCSWVLDWGVPTDQLYHFDNPQYDHPPTRGNYMVPILVVLLVTTWTVVPLRLWTRIRILKSFAPDDWFIIPAALSVTCLTTLTLIQHHYAPGVHLYDIRPQYFEGYQMMVWAIIVVYTFAIGFPKLSALMFYRRFANEQWFKWTIWGMTGYTVAWMITFLVLDLTVCTPIEFNWANVSGHCIPLAAQNALIWVHAGSNLFSDVMILLLPLPTIIGIMLPFKQKIALYTIFLLGTLTVAAATARIVIYHYYVNGSPWDGPWTAYNLNILLNIECHIAVFCASAPVLKPLFVRAVSKFSSYSSTKNDTTASRVSNRNANLSSNRPTGQREKSDLTDLDLETGGPDIYNTGETDDQIRQREIEMGWRDADDYTPVQKKNVTSEVKTVLSDTPRSIITTTTAPIAPISPTTEALHHHNLANPVPTLRQPTSHEDLLSVDDDDDLSYGIDDSHFVHTHDTFHPPPIPPMSPRRLSEVRDKSPGRTIRSTKTDREELTESHPYNMERRSSDALVLNKSVTAGMGKESAGDRYDGDSDASSVAEIRR